MKSWVFSVQNYPDSRPSVENCPAGKSPPSAAIEPSSRPESRVSGSRAPAERLDCGESRRSLYPSAGPRRPHATIVAIAHPPRLPARYGSSHGPRFARPIAPRSRPPEPNRPAPGRRLISPTPARATAAPSARSTPGAAVVPWTTRPWPHPEQRGRRRRRRPLPRPHGRPLFGRSHRRTRRGRLLPVAP